MQVDIRQQGGANRPLWDPKFRSLKEAMLHQSCFEEASDEFEELLVSNAFCQALQQNVMLDIVKGPFNVSFNDPVVFAAIVDVAVEGFDTIHRFASWPKAIGAIEEVAFPARF